MAEFLQVEFRTVALAAFFPSLLYYFSVYIMVDAIARKHNIQRLDLGTKWMPRDMIRQAFSFLLPLILLIMFLFVLQWRPSRAAITATLVLIVLHLLNNRRRLWSALGAFPRAVADVGFSLLPLMMICAMAGLIIGVLNITGLGFAFTQIFAKVGNSGNLLLLLVLAAVVSIVLGMGMPTLGVYLLLAALIAPSIVEFGVSPLAAHLFCLYFGVISLITPPVAISSFTAAGMTNSSPMGTAVEGVKIGWLAFIIPFVFAYSPTLLGQGHWFLVISSFVLVSTGITYVTYGLVGYFQDRIPKALRILLLLFGLAIIITQALGQDETWRLWGNLLGAMGLGLIIFKFINSKRRSYMAKKEFQKS